LPFLSLCWWLFHSEVIDEDLGRLVCQVVDNQIGDTDVGILVFFYLLVDIGLMFYQKNEDGGRYLFIRFTCARVDQHFVYAGLLICFVAYQDMEPLYSISIGV
jgi:hypothetical protein